MRIKLKYTNNVSLYIEGETLHVIKNKSSKMDWIICWNHCSRYLYLGKYYFRIYKYELETSIGCFFSILTVPMNILLFKMYVCPRALIAASVGASLAIAGCLMQTLTKNPLASPDFIGLNSGAAFFIVVAIVIFSVTSLSAFTWIALFRSGGCSCTCICF